MLDTNGPARMHLARRDPDLAAHAELAAIGKLRGGIVQQNGRIDLVEEAGHDIRILGNHRFRMGGGPAVDVVDGARNPVHEADRDDGIEIFRAPVLVVCLVQIAHALKDFPCRPHLAARLHQRLDQRRKQPVGIIAVDQQRLGRPANAGPPHLGIDDDRNGHVEIGGAVHIDVAETFEMRKDRHPRLALHPRNEALATARHDDVDAPVKPRQHGAHSGTIRNRHHLDGMFRQTRHLQPVNEAGMNGRRRMQAVRAAAQDDRIACLEAQRPGIGRHIRPALIDHADDTKRRAHALDMQPVRPVPFGDDVPNRILELGDRPNAIRHVGNALGIQRQTIEEGAGDTGLLGRLDVDRIGRQDRSALGIDAIGHRKQRGTLLLRRRRRQRTPAALA